MSVLAYRDSRSELRRGHHDVAAVDAELLVLDHLAREAGLLCIERLHAPDSTNCDDRDCRTQSDVPSLHGVLLYTGCAASSAVMLHAYRDRKRIGGVLSHFWRSAAWSAAFAPALSPRASRACAMRRQFSARSALSLPAHELERAATFSACT